MMASHYGVGVLPARPKRPKDKAKVECGVRFAQSCVLGRLRNQTFFSLDEANAAIREAVERINTHVMRRLDQYRRDLFEAMERPALAVLPAEEYEFAEWRLARVSTDYHVEFERYFYSVPHSLIREQVDVRATSRTIEIFFKGKRVAAHQRRYGGARFGTDPDHMPVRTAATRNGRRSASGAGLVRSVHRPRGSSSPSLPAGRIRNRDSEHASAFSSSTRRSTRHRLKPFRPVLSRSAA